MKRTLFTTITIVVGVVLILFGVLCLQFFQSFVNAIIASRLPLKENTETFDLWRKPPATPMLKAYFFNVTNAQEFLDSSGSIKLQLQEFGPYTYSEKWEKVDTVWHPNGTLTYKQNKMYFFEPSLSIGSEDDAYVFPNVPLLSALSSLKFSSGVAKKAISTILDILKLQPFNERSVKDIMWGYDDPLLKLGKSVLPEGKRVPFDKFGFFYGKNNTPGNPFTVFTGQEKLADFARINVYNGKEILDFWKNPNVLKNETCVPSEESEENDGDEEPSCVKVRRSDDYCNMINGTDATGFPSMLNENSTLYIFNPDLCRSMKLVYKENVKQQDLPALRFVPAEETFGDMETYPQNECYCVDGPPCSKRGTFNISVCQFGSPVFLSWPHFLHGDPSLREALIGLRPDPSRHQFYLDIQPKLGVPMQAKGRVQINIQMTRIPEIPQASRLANVLIPVIWFEDGIEKLPESVTGLLRQAVYVPEVAELALAIACFGFGSLLLICGLIVVIKTVRRKPDGRPRNGHATVAPENHQMPDMNDKATNGIKNGGTIPYKNGIEMENTKNGDGNGISNGHNGESKTIKETHT